MSGASLHLRGLRKPQTIVAFSRPQKNAYENTAIVKIRAPAIYKKRRSPFSDHMRHGAGCVGTTILSMSGSPVGALAGTYKEMVLAPALRGRLMVR